ncbi:MULTISPECIES: hypothetical protein [unclassified Maridesulfovibrio]|uniref:hypothetical protein n=1 Tax=unclassified Maridesulfovibrio TaxID=2794999 RepID=UPI003B3C797A
MIKMIRTGLISTVMVVLMCGGVFAQGTFVPQGSAVVSALHIRYKDACSQARPSITLTNITNETIRVKVTMFDHTGDDISHFGTVYTGSRTSASAQMVTTGENVFEIPPHSARRYSGYNRHTAPIYVFGYAKIEWSSNDPQLMKALVATCIHYESSNVSSSHSWSAERYLINNGQPF